MIDITRRKGESFDGLLRRFTRRVQQSGRLLQAKKIRFYSSKPSKNKQHVSALRRLEVQKKRDYLIRTGQLVEEQNNRRPSR